MEREKTKTAADNWERKGKGLSGIRALGVLRSFKVKLRLGQRGAQSWELLGEGKEKVLGKRQEARVGKKVTRRGKRV